MRTAALEDAYAAAAETPTRPDRDEMLIIDPAARGRIAPDCIAETEEGRVEIDGMDGLPVGKPGVYGIMRDCALLEPGDAGIVHHDIRLGDVCSKVHPVDLGRDVEPAGDCGTDSAPCVGHDAEFSVKPCHHGRSFGMACRTAGKYRPEGS